MAAVSSYRFAVSAIEQLLDGQYTADSTFALTSSAGTVDEAGT
jgi:hypothetical protein